MSNKLLLPWYGKIMKNKYHSAVWAKTFWTTDQCSRHYDHRRHVMSSRKLAPHNSRMF